MSTAAEQEADRFDCDLYRLIQRADVRNKHWAAIALDLTLARRKVRALMSQEDRERTSS